MEQILHNKILGTSQNNKRIYDTNSENEPFLESLIFKKNTLEVLAYRIAHIHFESISGLDNLIFHLRKLHQEDKQILKDLTGIKDYFGIDAIDSIIYGLKSQKIFY